MALDRLGIALVGAAFLVGCASATANFFQAERHVCFYQFGMTQYEPEEDAISQNDVCKDLEPPAIDIPFMGGIESSAMAWSTNGALYFNGNDCDGELEDPQFPMEAPVLFAYWTAVNANSGLTSFNYLTDDASLAPIRADIIWAFEMNQLEMDALNAAVDWALQITVLGHDCEARGPDETVSYQIVLLTDETKTYVIFKYGWMLIPGDVCNAENDRYKPKIGFNYNNNDWLYEEGVLSSSSSAKDVQSTSNCGVTGMHMFEVSETGVAEPTGRAVGLCEGSGTPRSCFRCANTDTEAPHCERSGYCFEPGTMIADMECSSACLCMSDATWGPCAPLKKASQLAKEACTNCAAQSSNGAPCFGQVTGPQVVFVDSPFCGIFDCILTQNKKACEDVAPCTGADIRIDRFLNEKFFAKSGGYINFCDVADKAGL